MVLIKLAVNKSNNNLAIEKIFQVDKSRNPNYI